MNKSWVVVADHSQARIFSADDTKKKLSQLHALDHSAARHKGEALHQEGHGSAPADKFYMQREGEAFVENLTVFLEEEFRKKQFESLVLICPAKFLGECRKAISTNLQRAVSQEISKDLIHQEVSHVEKLVFA